MNELTPEQVQQMIGGLLEEYQADKKRREDFLFLYGAEGAPPVRDSYRMQNNWYIDRMKPPEGPHGRPGYGTEMHRALEEVCRMAQSGDDDAAEFLRQMRGIGVPPPPPPAEEPVLGDAMESVVGQQGKRKVSVFLREGPADGELGEQFTNDAGVPPYEIKVNWSDPESGSKTPGGLVIPEVLIYRLCAEQPSASAFEYEYIRRESESEQEAAIAAAIARGANIVNPYTGNRSRRFGAALWPPPGESEQYNPVNNRGQSMPPVVWVDEATEEKPENENPLSQEDIDALARLNRIGEQMNRNQGKPGRSFHFGISLSDEDREEVLNLFQQHAEREGEWRG